MAETNKEYKYRVFVSELIEYINSLTDTGGLCDCEKCEDYENHTEDCICIQVILDVVKFHKKLTDLQTIKT